MKIRTSNLSDLNGTSQTLNYRSSWEARIIMTNINNYKVGEVL